MTVTAILPVPVRFTRRREAVFAAVAGTSPLDRAVRALEVTGDVVIAVAGPLADQVREALAGQSFSRVRVVVSEPPGERVHCVAAGLAIVADTSHVVVHDIEWPTAGTGVVDRVAAALREGAVAVMPSCPVTDSVKSVDPDGALTATLDRSQLRTVQYPRGFAADVLAQLVGLHRSGPFDELEAALSAGVPVSLIDGDAEALRVELPRDTDYLAALITTRRDLPTP